MPTNHRTNVSLDDLHQLQQRIEKVNGALEAVAETTASSLECHAVAIKQLDRRVRQLAHQLDELDTDVRNTETALGTHAADPVHHRC